MPHDGGLGVPDPHDLKGRCRPDCGLEGHRREPRGIARPQGAPIAGYGTPLWSQIERLPCPWGLRCQVGTARSAVPSQPARAQETAVVAPTAPPPTTSTSGRRTSPSGRGSTLTGNERHSAIGTRSPHAISETDPWLARTDHPALKNQTCLSSRTVRRRARRSPFDG